MIGTSKGEVFENELDLTLARAAGMSHVQYYTEKYSTEPIISQPSVARTEGASPPSTMPLEASGKPADAFKSVPPGVGTPQYDSLPESTNIIDERGEPSIIPDALEIGKGQEKIEQRDKDLLTPRKNRGITGPMSDADLAGKQFAGDVLQGPWSKRELEMRLHAIGKGFHQRGLTWNPVTQQWDDINAKVIPIRPPGPGKQSMNDADERPIAGQQYAQLPTPPVQDKFEPLDDKQAERLLYDTGVMSSKFQEMPASDIDAVLRMTQDEHNERYNEFKKAWGGNLANPSPDPAGRVRIRASHPAVKEYIDNLPDDVIVHDMKDGTYIFRLKPALTSMTDETPYELKAGDKLAMEVRKDPIATGPRSSVSSGSGTAPRTATAKVTHHKEGEKPVPDEIKISAGPERITGAALQSGKDVYIGSSHLDVMLKHPTLDLKRVEDGFVTSRGRFVSRKQAMEIAKKSEQPLTGRGRSGVMGGRKELMHFDIYPD